MSRREDSKLLASLIFDKYEKVALTANETSKVTGVPEETLKKDRAEGTGIPFTRRSNKEKAKPLYPITSIANFLVENEVKTLS